MIGFMIGQMNQEHVQAFVDDVGQLLVFPLKRRVARNSLSVFYRGRKRGHREVFSDSSAGRIVPPPQV
jgi:hypothetical protein